MKATGIVRKIDDLGRVQIPKEIRRSLRLREGDSLEVFTDNDGGVIFRKYDASTDFREIIDNLLLNISVDLEEVTPPVYAQVRHKLKEIQTLLKKGAEE